MGKQKRTFEISGPVRPDINYVVSRTEEIAAFMDMIKRGRYIVIFAPRQTGKTTFFRQAINKLIATDSSYLPILLDFQIYQSTTPDKFYAYIQDEIADEILNYSGKQQIEPPENLRQFLSTHQMTDNIMLLRFFQQLQRILPVCRCNATGRPDKKVVLIIDEFDGIPRDALSGFLFSLGRIYLSVDLMV